MIASSRDITGAESDSPTIVRFATANGLALRYADDGPRNGEAIVFIHALGCDLHLWDAVAAEFAKTKRVVRYDLRGHGASEYRGQESTAEDHVLDLAGLLQHLGITDATVIGISVGGLIAQAVALMRPSLVQRLVLCATGARIWSADTWIERIRMVSVHGLESIADGAMGRWFTPAFRQREPALVKGMRAVLVRTPLAGYVAACVMLRDTDLREQIGRIAVPTLVLVSEHDPVAPLTLATDMVSRIPNARYAMISDVGHLAPVELPGAVIAQLKAFIP